MKRKRFSEEQIIAILREHEAGVSTADLCRKHGMCFRLPDAMRSAMQLKMDPAVFEIIPSGVVWAGIYVEHDGMVFPDRKWDDLAFLVLGYWAEPCLKIIDGSTETQRFNFCDGPVYFDCTANADELAVEWVHETSPPRVIKRFKSSAREFLQSYVSCFEQLCAAYNQVDCKTYNPAGERSTIEYCSEVSAAIRSFLARSV